MLTKQTLVLVALFAWACGGSTDDGAATGGAAGATGGSPGGGAAGAAGGGGSAGVAGTGGSGATASCDALKGQHSAAVENAKVCTVGSTTACTAGVDTSISSCGKWVLGDSSNTAEHAELATLKEQYKAAGCPLESCGVGGSSPMPTECKPTGQGGSSGVCVPKT
ncbi:MAG: hypothetical protein HYZ29_12330 [Myxococcales bacterium]|nr:hypothetical protein [Myxococcales bacterium]